MVDRVDIQSVLSQMRQVKDQLRAQQVHAQPQSAAELTRVRSARLAQEVQALDEPSKVNGDNSVPNFSTMFKTLSITSMKNSRLPIT